MADLTDIEQAIQAGLHAANALESWVRGADARDSVRSDIQALNQGREALEKLRRNLREGRMHVAVPEDAYDYRPISAGRHEPDEGHHLCEACKGEGVQMVAKMYPSGHTEVNETCEECDGEGQVEIEVPAPEGQP